MGVIVNKKTFAGMNDVDPKTVTNWITEGMPTVGGGGRGRAVEIDTAQGISWLQRRAVIRAVGEEDEDGETGKGSSEDRMLKRIRYEEIEHRLELRKKQAGPVDGFMDIVLRIAGVFSSQLDGLSSRTCSDLAVMDDPAEIRAYIHGETRQIRASTAERILEEVRQLALEADELLASSNSGSNSGPASSDAE